MFTRSPTPEPRNESRSAATSANGAFGATAPESTEKSVIGNDLKIMGQGLKIIGRGVSFAGALHAVAEVSAERHRTGR